MNSQTLLQLLLVLHITGFVTLAGIVAADTAIYGRLRKFLIADKNRALVMLDSSASFGLLIRISAIVVIATGIGMVSLAPGFSGMLWFKIKMVLVLGIIVNGALVGQRLMNRLKSLLNTPIINNVEIESVKGRLSLMYSVQLLLFVTIFTLSVFKF
jgi:hypothetical protein